MRLKASPASSLFCTLMLTLLAGSMISASASAQMTRVGKRANSWEASVGLYGTASDSSDGENGSSLDIDTGYGIAFGFAYNYSQNLALRFDGSWARPDYTAVFNTDDDGLVEVDHTLNLFTGHVSGVWNILDGPLTPYVQAGLGWTYVDSNIADGPPTTGCWWDPWWGYICSNFYSTYSDSNFSWNVGAGLRFDLNRNTFVRGGYERVTIDGNSSADPTFDAFRLELGWKF
jgi:opacity protein-like surface antigen